MAANIKNKNKSKEQQLVYLSTGVILCQHIPSKCQTQRVQNRRTFDTTQCWTE